MLIMLLVREAKETPAEYLTIELLLSGEADLPAMAVATAVAMTAASCLLSGVIKERENKNRVCFLKLKNSGFCLFLLKPLRENRRGCGKAAGTAGRGQWAGTQGLATSDQYRHNRDFMQNLQRKLAWGI